jgi:hypothetical protein
MYKISLITDFQQGSLRPKDMRKRTKGGENKYMAFE